MNKEIHKRKSSSRTCISYYEGEKEKGQAHESKTTPGKKTRKKNTKEREKRRDSIARRMRATAAPRETFP